MAVKIVVGRLAFEFGGKFVLDLFQIQRLETGAGTAANGLAVAQHDFLQSFGPAAGGLAQVAQQHVDDRGGEGDAARFEIQNIGRLDAARNEKHRHVAHDFAAGGDFDDVAEKLVDLGVGAGDFRPALRQAHAGGLFLEIGVLAAGHFVLINFRRAAARGGVERRVVGARPFPSNRKIRSAPPNPGRCRAGCGAARRRWN